MVSVGNLFDLDKTRQGHFPRRTRDDAHYRFTLEQGRICKYVPVREVCLDLDPKGRRCLHGLEFPNGRGN